MNDGSESIKIVNIGGTQQTDEVLDLFENETTTTTTTAPVASFASEASEASEGSLVSEAPEAPEAFAVGASDGGARRKTQHAEVPQAQAPAQAPEASEEEEDASSVAASSEMGTASLIANGCTYTILEQMLMTDGDDGEKRNVAYMIERCAKALEGILGHLVVSSQK